MRARNDVAPNALSVELHDYGVEVEYLDNRTTVHRGAPQAVTDTLATAPGKGVHVLVTDPTETEGVTMYVNDLTSHGEVLESSGVGRVILGEDEEEELFPDILVRRVPGHRFEIEANPEVARGRVFVFVKDDWGENSYEFIVE